MRPSLQTFSKSGTLHANDGDRDGKHQKYVFVTSLSVDNDGNFSEWSTPNCDASIWDAPWYYAESDFSLPIPSSISLPVCTAPNDDGDRDAELHSMATIQHTPTPTPSATPTQTPSPTPVPTATPTATNLVIVRLDLGWFDVSETPITGNAGLSGNTWTFPALSNTLNYQDGHLYVFFVAHVKQDNGGHHHHGGDGD